MPEGVGEMRLGIVMLGTGAYAAANIGAIRALRARGIEPYAVCGMQTGAMIAALHLSGMDDSEMENALAHVMRGYKKMLRSRCASADLLAGRKSALLSGGAAARLLDGKGLDRLLGLCDRRGMFICRSASSGRRIIFSSRPYVQGTDAALTLQATVSFACCAALAKPPFLTSMTWLTSAIVPEENPAYAADQLLRMGADRVLVIEPRACACHKMDALELSDARIRWMLDEAMPEGVGLLRLMMPEDIGALAFGRMQRIAQIGYDGAQSQLDGALGALGMAMCRVIPFKQRAADIIRRQ